MTFHLLLGYRTEEKDGTTRVLSGNSGYEYEKRGVNTVEITDFDFNIDLTEHIIPHGDIYTIPKDDDDYDIKDGKDIMQVLEEYYKSGSGFKEIEMRKVSHEERGCRESDQFLRLCFPSFLGYNLGLRIINKSDRNNN